ncbi:MAG: UDP-4-amino-4,6-dideoxy-N-acetyl-beta-L-altrosamine transaminase [Methylococcales bacterium]|jgi:perosamine synthetase|nr:UDP-4-amino-4,6-dideoxy-N-acetyl-beta-L-altrosamine transaminase [Methylococcales bacterium]MBT7410666.1 UDP-4-amino-4,6-dideoxy-N-acetyl-beta-L-altrosamine transaminase [Methylococcales bacterium]
MNDFIPYGKQIIEDDDIEAVLQTLKSDWLTQGPKITEFEQAVADKVNAKHAIAVATGTAALHCACFAAGVTAGDEIITSPITFASSGNCGLFLGATVKFVDIRADTYCIDPQKLETAITAKTKAIIPVDFTGQPCDMDEIISIAKKHNIPVIQDAAHSIGAIYKNKMVGSIADLTIFSFHPVKHITTAEGGMIVTNDDQLAKQCRLFRTHGITNSNDDMQLVEQASDNENQYLKTREADSKAAWYYEMQALGNKYCLTDMQCALGISQLKKLDNFIKRRREIVAVYNEAFSKNKKLIIPFQETDRKNAFHLYMLKLNLIKMDKSRRKVFDELRAMKIGVHVHYIPLHLQPYYREKFGYKRNDFPVSEEYYDSALTIPLFPGMTDEQVQRVIDSINQVVS